MSQVFQHLVAQELKLWSLRVIKKHLASSRVPLWLLLAAALTFYAPLVDHRLQASTLEETVAELTFESYRVKLPMDKPLSDCNDTKFLGVRSDSAGANWLRYATPKFSAAPEAEIKVILIKNFRGVSTLKSDIQTDGYDVEPSRKSLVAGDVYYWSTPTEGSSIYYYVENPSNRNIAVKIGPIAATVAKDISFLWDEVRWSEIPRQLKE